MNIYEISYPGFFPDYPDYAATRSAETPGKARYAEYVEFCDAYDMPFGEYQKITKVRKIGSDKVVPGEHSPHQTRIDSINKLIVEIGNRGRRFLYSEKHSRYANFFWAGSKLWLMDNSTGLTMVMNADQQGKTHDQAAGFSQGGTMWGLMCDFTDFIFGDDDANHNHGYGGLYCPHWGYAHEDMEAIQSYARSIRYLREE